MTISRRERRVLHLIERDLSHDLVLVRLSDLFPERFPAQRRRTSPVRRARAGRPPWRRPVAILALAVLALAGGTVGVLLNVPVLIATSFAVVLITGILAVTEPGGRLVRRRRSAAMRTPYPVSGPIAPPPTPKEQP